MIYTNSTALGFSLDQYVIELTESMYYKHFKTQRNCLKARLNPNDQGATIISSKKLKI